MCFYPHDTRVSSEQWKQVLKENARLIVFPVLTLGWMFSVLVMEQGRGRNFRAEG